MQRSRKQGSDSFGAVADTSSVLQEGEGKVLGKLARPLWKKMSLPNVARQMVAMRSLNKKVLSFGWLRKVCPTKKLFAWSRAQPHAQQDQGVEEKHHEGRKHEKVIGGGGVGEPI